MRSVNKVLVMGYLAADPDHRDNANGHKLTKFKVATNHEWVDSEGEKKQKTDYHKVVAWSKLADIASQYLKKGSGVYVEGRLANNSYEDKEGKKKMFTEVVADTINFINYKKSKDAEELNLVEVSE